MKSEFSFEIRILTEQKSKPDTNFLGEFGFSALICNEFTQNRILFDTGATFETLENNLEQFGEDISEINKIVISHNHSEQTGGLKGIYEKNPEIDIYVPEEIKKNYSHLYKKAKVHGVSEELEIDENITSTGQLGNYLKEQSLFLKTIDDEGVILVGCAHPGMDEIITLAKKKFPKIAGLIGGLHEFRKYYFLDEIDMIGACHCTKHLEEISKRFPETYKEIFAGEILRF
ncbi:MAG: 7,8 dihydropteroate synthase (Methanopterin) [Promethearchaeota archaeon]|nr:MAG: 7,8 dihydropteroate synthase (Methanopterin) [Candidatus Lokiarchaeota archaeon]